MDQKQDVPGSAAVACLQPGTPAGLTRQQPMMIELLKLQILITLLDAAIAGRTAEAMAA